MGTVDLHRLKEGFTSLLSKAEPTVLPAFLLWIDMKVSEYKVHGYMFSDPENYDAPWIQLAVNAFNLRIRGFPLNGAPDQSPAPAPMMPTGQPPKSKRDLITDIKQEIRTPEKVMISHDNPRNYQTPPPHSTVSSPGTTRHYQTPPPHSTVSSPSTTRPDTHYQMSSTNSPYNLSTSHYMDRVYTSPDRHPMPRANGSSPALTDYSESSIDSPKPTLKVPILPVMSSQESSLPVKSTKDKTVVEKLKQHLNHNSTSAAAGSASTSTNSTPDMKSEKEAFMQSIANVCADVLVGGDNKKPKLLECTVCDRKFLYSSSFRRHMRLHQGVYTHMCAVCGRKFTRKEHFIRHKCNRRPNKPSRGEEGSPVSSTGRTPKIEYPPNLTILGGENKENAADMVIDDVDDSALDDDFEPLDYSVPQSAQDENTASGGGESRRKAAKPRRIIQTEEEQDSFNNSFLYDDEDGPDEENEDISIKAAELSSHANNNKYEVPKFHIADNGEYLPNSPEKMSTMPINLVKSQSLQYTGEKEENIKSEHLSMLPEQSLSPSSLNSDATPTAIDEAGNPVVGTPGSDIVSLDTGNYMVSTVDEEASSDDQQGKFIKVVKHSNYLKLQKEAKMVNGRLCFVCPNCSKVFHRSSNFSRHMRIHRGIFSYLCPTCNRGFFRKEHFQKHKCSRKSMSYIWDRKTKIDMANDETSKLEMEDGAALGDEEACQMDVSCYDIDESDGSSIEDGAPENNGHAHLAVNGPENNGHAHLPVNGGPPSHPKITGNDEHKLMPITASKSMIMPVAGLS